MMEKSNRVVPKMRFKEFEGLSEWPKYKLADYADFRRGSFPQPYGKSEWYDGSGSMPFVQVVDVGSNLKLVDKTKQKISVLAQPKSIFVRKNTIVVTLQGSIGRVAITQYDSYLDRTLLIFQSYKEKTDKRFWAYTIQQKFNTEKEKAPGGTIKTITKESLSNFEVFIPTYGEQQKIGHFFEIIDEMIQVQQSKVNKVKDIKSAYLSEMFPKEGEKYPKKRFEGFTEPWTAKKLGSLLDYEQPTNYLVKSDSYDDSYLTPVLTAGKSFLLGYTNETEGIYKADNNNGVIIFDDFTTSSHFVDFDFKVKSSAMKFLRTNQSSFNLYFLYNLLTSINYSPESHERHWISIFSEFEVLVPTKKEQEKIAQLFKNLDKQISIEEKKLAKLENLKQGYLNDMFV